MAPKANAMSLLFHPKKKQNKPNQDQRTAGTNGARPQNASSSPKLTAPGPPKDKARAAAAAGSDDDEVFNLPNTPYSEFRILSSKLQGWKYDVMKFDSRKPVDIMRWAPPIKLNRKDIRKDIRKDDPASSSAVPQAVGPMLGPDGKPVIGVDGKMVMVDAEGKPIHHGDHGYGGGTGASGSKDKGKGKDGPGRKRFQKKTRQVFLVPDEVRQLRKEERYPWVMEDSSPNNVESWIGHLEEVSKAETHGFFMPAANDAFKFVPAHRWYKFQKKIKHDLPTDAADVENLWTKTQKKDPATWLAQFNGGKGASSATAALFKQEAEGKPNINEGQSLGPGGRKLKTVDSGANLFGDDDEDGDARRRRERELGGEGDIDEQVYEEDFADDEEAMNVDETVDEEQKEIEERLKREYQRANKQNETGLDVEDEDEADTPKNRQQKDLEKIMATLEGNAVYESDDEKNPYASSEEEEEPEPVQTGPAIQEQPQPAVPNKPASPMPGLSKPPTATNSRATSPASPGLGGHSLVAKRATSPNAPKARIPGASGSRGNSPTGSRANSPTPSRATSPLANPPANGEVRKSVKRKADDSPASPTDGGQNGAPRPQKKKKFITPEDLETKVIAWIKGRENATTRECIAAFSVYMDEKTKIEFTNIVRRVAILTSEKVLILRPDYAKKAGQ